MSTINDGGPAFPVPANAFNDMEGMTLRDYFAAKAMQGMCANPACDMDDSLIVRTAYEIAYAMLQARRQ